MFLMKLTSDEESKVIIGASIILNFKNDEKVKIENAEINKSYYFNLLRSWKYYWGGDGGGSFKCKTNTSCAHQNGLVFEWGKCQQDSYWVHGFGYGCECSAGTSNENCYA